MISRRIKRVPQYLYHTFLSLPGKKLFFVTDQANWILYWVRYYVATNLEKQFDLHSHLISEPLGLRNQVIHFIDRYSYLNGTFRRLHPSNRIFLTWFHGDPVDVNPATRSLFEALAEAINHVEKVVVSCQTSKKSLVEFGIPENQLATIPLGVDLTHFTPPTAKQRLVGRASLDIPPEATCIGLFQKDGVGWQEGNEPKLIKGPDLFLKVIANLSDRYENLMVLLTGPARGYVKRGLEQLGVPYVHHFLPNYPDIVNYYHTLDLYIIPARCEGGPASLLESWATGVPLVSTRVGMPADLIRHRQNGMLADVEDLDGLTEYAVALIEDHQLREKCRRQALNDVKQYNWPVVAEQYYRKLYQPFLR